MEFAGFNWDAGNRNKCQKQGVSITEIESIFSRPVVIIARKGKSPRRAAISGDWNRL